MREVERRPLGRGRLADTGREESGAERTAELPPLQYESLFRAPDWPPEDETG